MSPLYITVLLATAAFSLDIPCKDGEDIRTQSIQDIDYLIGNWSYFYHYRTIHDEKTDPGELVIDMMIANHAMKCPKIEIEPLASDIRKETESKCGNDKSINWEDAKLMFTAPLMAIKDAIIFIGEKDYILMADCKIKIQMVPKKVSDDIMMLVNPEENVVEMLTRKPIKASELDCIANNVDVGRGMDKIVMCY